MEILQHTEVLLLRQFWPRFDDKIQNKLGNAQHVDGSHCQKAMESETRESLVAELLHAYKGF